jgi:hypothetical protein
MKKLGKLLFIINKDILHLVNAQTYLGDRHIFFANSIENIPGYLAAEQKSLIGR